MFSISILCLHICHVINNIRSNADGSSPNGSLLCIMCEFVCLFIGLYLYHSTRSCTCVMTNDTVIYLYLNSLLIFNGVCGSYVTYLQVQYHYVLNDELSEEGGHQPTEYIELIQTMANDHSMAGLPFADVAENIILHAQHNNYNKFNYINSTNTDMLTNIDLDGNNMKKYTQIMIHLLSLMKQLIMTTICIFFIQTLFCSSIL